MESEHISSNVMKHLQTGSSLDDQVIIVTGYSGAGKSSVLRTLEDAGFLCVDNLPIALLGQFFDLVKQTTIGQKRFALGIDIRGGDRMECVVEALLYMRTQVSFLKNSFFTRECSYIDETISRNAPQASTRRCYSFE